MSDTQSIEDLTAKNTPSKGPKKLASELRPEEKFAEKIPGIRLKEKEVEIARTAAKIDFPYANLAGFPITADAIGHGRPFTGAKNCGRSVL